ncbi:phosphotransferase family protein [Neolewinella agarilytica]|uniref:phosphotransferase family protein n=1 Tax=Neolewinella agarilytica TaxID=478744 RepID=UPI0023567F0A|nr:phosphotransferase [Neolewinella agarilytica]
MSTVSISNEREATTKEGHGLYIPGVDGHPRWIWPADSKRPTFLQFFQPISWKQHIYVIVIRLIFLLRLQQLVFSSIPLKADFTRKEDGWAVFTGTPGPNRKLVIINKKGEIAKVAVGKMAIPNLRNEAFFLRDLQANEQRFSFRVPKLIRYKDEELVMEKIPSQGTWSRFTQQHATALWQLRRVKAHNGLLSDWREWDRIHKRINQLKNEPHADIPVGLITDLLKMVVQEDRTAAVSYGLAHGDFTPWNTLRTNDDQLAIIDWELGQTEMPLGFDFFHFHLQNGIMVERKSWQQIYRGMQEVLTEETRSALFGNAEADVDRYLRLYLMYHISYYLSLYQQQQDWHQQIYWQLDVWSDALVSLLDPEDQRRALLSRLFDGLKNRDYAVLKMEHEDPLALPPGSDLDILLSREDARQLVDLLERYPLLARAKVVRKSFMTSLLLVLQDGQILSVDLIWKLKRKATVFMDAGRMIQRADKNRYGVRVVSAQDTRRYVELFYGLNGAEVPAKFGHLETFPGGANSLAENKGSQGLGNRAAYLLDTLRTMVYNRGFLITFSGVDGAGKSTIIERVVTMLDKEFRRPVKVLRHRPSVLPILSAWRYGKKGAEEKSMASLPRTGNNTSLVSSLLRFSYYYLDYLLGQWYVHFRYVLRGYVVVYDRYYYDFIIDPRRTNLELPGWVTAAGFRLLQKPALNFFLYADPDTILARKQELDRDTIVSLTKQYRNLFEGFEKKNTSGQYVNLENVVLEDSLQAIRTSLLKQNV